MRTMRILSRFAVVSAVLLLAAVPVAAESAEYRAEILWDKWGVPHIFADDEAQAAYGFGWAQLRSHGDLILELYAQARGRAAEYFGEDHLDSDKTVWTHDVPGLAAANWEAQNERMQRFIHAFVAGMNDFAEAHRDTLDPKVHAVLPVTPEDIFAHGVRTLQMYFSGRVSSVESAGRRWEEQAGSNAWAIAPSRTENGHAMLLSNPHLAWSGMQTFYEAHWVTPESNFYGTTLVGGPVLSMGFNDHLGWTHTVNTINVADTYELTLAEGGYLFDGEVMPFEETERTIKVRLEDGEFREETLTVRRSVHGPVVAMREGEAWAHRIAGMERSGTVEQTLDMTQARSLEEFEGAFSRLQLSMFNAIYADRDGNILLVFNGTIPNRGQGDWSYWSGRVPGDTSDTLWTGYHAYDELPRVVNPESGWLQNANEPPWYMTIPFPLNPADFPAYMAPVIHAEAGIFRPLRSMEMLHTHDQLTFEKVVELRHNAQSGLAQRILDELVEAAAASEDELVQQAGAALAEWDQQYLPDSKGAVLFVNWYQNYVQAVSRARTSLFARPWDWNAEPLSVPAGIGDTERALEALATAAGLLRSAGAPLDIPWGMAMRLRKGEVDMPGTGGPSADSFRVMSFGNRQGARYYATHGDTFVCIVEFSDPVRAKVITTYGNATQPGSPHIGDQIPMLVEDQMRPAWRDRGEIEANLSLHEVLGAG